LLKKCFKDEKKKSLSFYSLLMRKKKRGSRKQMIEKGGFILEKKSYVSFGKLSNFSSHVTKVTMCLDLCLHPTPQGIDKITA
jgi:hypothetical protein